MKKIALIICGLLIFAGCNGTTVTVEDQPEEAPRVTGNPDAAVKIIEYSDYECPFCGRFHEEAFPQLKSEYIDNGLVSFEFRDFPLPFHTSAMDAARAAHCAGDQGEYYPMSEMIFDNQDDLRKKAYVAYAQELELDVEEFDMCLNSNKFDKVIQNNMQEGVAMGVEGTPAVFINDTMVPGAQDFSVYKGLIDQELGN